MSRRDPLMGAEPDRSPQAAPPPDLLLFAVRRRQRTRALIMALLLGAFVILIFGISIAKMGLKG